MIDPWPLALAALAGTVLGAVFFGGLWWTVRKAMVSARPALWFFASAVLRTAATLLGFYLVSGGHWERMSACLLGFLLARFAVMRITRAPRQRRPARELPDAP